MNPYLSRLRAALNFEKGIPYEPSKPSKPGYEGFEGTQSMGVLKNRTLEAQPRRVQNFKKGIPRQPSRTFAEALSALEVRCPDYVDVERWRQCVLDARRFLAEWGGKAHALGWTAGDLFGLHALPEAPSPSYSRLSRRDCVGLLWLLDGERVKAMTKATATIATAAGGTLTYYKRPGP